MVIPPLLGILILGMNFFVGFLNLDHEFNYYPWYQGILLVLVKGGRDYIYNPLEGNIYLVYKRHILPMG